jgi:hypothetical protein
VAGTLSVYPGLQVKTTRETIFGVKVDTAQSGREVRTVWGTSPRYKYRMQIVLRDELTGGSEVAEVVDLINDNYGSGDNFDITDPVTGTTVAVRLTAPLRIEQYRDINSWWIATIECISVLTA